LLNTPHLVDEAVAFKVHSLFGSVSGSGVVTDKYILKSDASGDI